MPEIVGRDAELRAVAAFMGHRPVAPSALVLEGDAGIGKSTLWRRGVELAYELGLRVLYSRPAEAERSLVYVGLGDLLEDVLDDSLPDLAPPRRRALGVAVLRDDVWDGPVDQRAVALALRDVLRRLGRDEPVVVAVDDVQWLDSSSSAALAFAVRRLPQSRVLMLFARRPGEPAGAATPDLALPPEQVQRVAVGPMTLGALHRLLRDRTGVSYPRQALLRIATQAGGNPFFALEIARVVGSAPLSPLDPMPVPATLEELLRARVAGLPGATLEALAYAAAIGPVPESLLRQTGVEPADIQPALDVHVVERVEGMLRFSHPLLESYLYRDLGADRRRVHARIAGLAEDPLVRARHLALSLDDPDPAVAAVLDDARDLALERGAAAAAAEFAEHAVRLTPTGGGEDWCRRTLAAAQAHHVAGEWTRARDLATHLLSQGGGGPWRVDAAMLLAELSVDGGTAFLEQALREATSPALRSVVHTRLAWATRFEGGGFDHAGAALALANRVGDGDLAASARAVKTILDWFAGGSHAPVELVELTRPLPRSLGGDRMVLEATQAVVNTLAPAPARDQARMLFQREYEESRDRDEPRSARALWGLAWVEFWAGRWALAADHAERAYEIAVQYGAEVPQDHLPIAVIAVRRGQLERARQHSSRALDLADRLGFRVPQHVGVLGLVSLGGGDVASALDWFAEADRRAAAMGWREPSVRWWVPDQVELLLELGRADDAVMLLRGWESDATRTGREWALANAARCRGLVAASRGEVAQALALLEQAVLDLDSVGDLFGGARARLALGTVRRRSRQKSPAREATASALEAFESLGAALWAGLARAELGRIGGRTRQEGLTAAELRVVSLVVEGRTNREIATALFLGERTVASHLTHIYAKLALRSRTELARWYHAKEPV